MWRTRATLKRPPRRRAERGQRRRVILAIETSCDDTCAAVVTPDGEIRSNVISSQGVHDRYGGVVPEVASRHHLELIGAVVDDALAQAGTTLPELDAIAVTQGPGLVGALLVGVSTAKALAAAHRLPLIPVDHLHGHVAASFLKPSDFQPPFLILIASGGHTLLARVEDHGPDWEVLGATHDDAAGEAFDKGARMLGLGYPGGPALQRLAEDGDPQALAFPTAQQVAGLDFSFSGLKTALLYKLRELGEEEGRSAAAPISPPPTSARSSRRWRGGSSARSSGPVTSGSWSPAASVPTAGCANGCAASASSSTSRRECAPTSRDVASAARHLPALPSRGTPRSTPTRRGERGLDALAAGRPLRPPRLPPVRRGTRGAPADPGGPAVHARGARHRARRRAPSRPTWSGFR